MRRIRHSDGVASAWAADVLQQGKVGFYSYLRANAASAGLAKSLGVVVRFTAAATY